MIAARLLEDHLDYSKWASALLLDAAAKLTPEELECDRKCSHGGILGTLQHIYLADRIWLSRFEGAGRTTMLDEGESMPDLAAMSRGWPPLLDRFRSLIRGFGDEGVLAHFQFRNLAGAEFDMPRWQALLHVVNHGTLHRGQVMAMLRQSGHKPPATDLLFYYRA
jgi:uncharacterized damage-inducible protein DinB